MKILIQILTISFIFLSISLEAQKRDAIEVPLSSPNESGMLKVNVHSGAINVTAHNKDYVEVTLNEKEGKSSNNKTRSGLKRIIKQGLDVTISEDDNEVQIISSQNKQIDIDIKVPTNFSLFLSTHHNGDVYVNGTSGEIEVQSHHGGIRMEDVSGSVVANTHHGAIVVTMDDVTRDTPMAFTTYHGDVDISFPANLGGKLKMKSSKGDIYTDFDFEPLKPKVTTTNKGSKKEIKLEGWTYGLIGSGGDELTFKTYHGDVIIRKN